MIAITIHRKRYRVYANRSVVGRQNSASTVRYLNNSDNFTRALHVRAPVGVNKMLLWSPLKLDILLKQKNYHRPIGANAPQAPSGDRTLPGQRVFDHPESTVIAQTPLTVDLYRNLDGPRPINKMSSCRRLIKTVAWPAQSNFPRRGKTDSDKLQLLIYDINTITICLEFVVLFVLLKFRLALWYESAKKRIDKSELDYLIMKILLSLEAFYFWNNCSLLIWHVESNQTGDLMHTERNITGSLAKRHYDMT